MTHFMRSSLDNVTHFNVAACPVIEYFNINNKKLLYMFVSTSSNTLLVRMSYDSNYNIY